METLKDKLWVWGHLAGSHNAGYKNIRGSFMSSAEGVAYMGARNVFMVAYQGKPQPPFDKYSKELSGLKQIKYSIVGDCSSPEKPEQLGDIDEVIAQAKKYSNVTGGVFDDFFSEKRLKIYTPEVLRKMRGRLHNEKLDMWCVFYAHQLHLDEIKDGLAQFDGVSFWTWKQSELKDFEANYSVFLGRTKNQRRMLGCYLYDYGEDRPMDTCAAEFQLERYTRELKAGEAEGIVFCSNTVMDLNFEAVKFTRGWIEKYGNIII